ncbi:LOW QUALITY PROTEIN: Lipase_GDSL domain-containing protein, partial [Cephalotus follicularis]
LQRLYDLGARRVLMTGTGPMGCVPAELAHSTNGECATDLQRPLALFNPQQIEMINGINSEIGHNVFVATNAYQIHMDFIKNPQTYAMLQYSNNLVVTMCVVGFVTSKVACCGQGPYNGLGLCTPLSNLCADRKKYAFWDAFHLSEKANRIHAQQILTGTPQMHPMNLSTIMVMDSRT